MNNINGKLRLQFYNLIDDLQIYGPLWPQLYTQLWLQFDLRINSQLKNNI